MREFAVPEAEAVPRRRAPVLASGQQAPGTSAAPPAGAGFAQAQVHAAKPKDLVINVIAPARIGNEALTDPPIIGPQAGLSLQLAENGTLQQDEYMQGDLTWTARGGGSRNVMAAHDLQWTLPASGGGATALPNSLSDAHLFSHKTRPASECLKAAAKQGFDWMTHDWRFEQNAKFIDTVSFAKRTFKRVYYYSYRADKTVGADMTARVDYYNVDQVQRI